jgi:hypothetical protein
VEQGERLAGEFVEAAPLFRPGAGPLALPRGAILIARDGGVVIGEQ